MLMYMVKKSRINFINTFVEGMVHQKSAQHQIMLIIMVTHLPGVVTSKTSRQRAKPKSVVFTYHSECHITV